MKDFLKSAFDFLSVFFVGFQWLKPVCVLLRLKPSLSKVEFNTRIRFTPDSEHVLVECLDTLEKVTLEFFKIRFPYKSENVLETRDYGYFDEWIGRFKKNSAWVYADYASRRAIISLDEKGLIRLWTRA